MSSETEPLNTKKALTTKTFRVSLRRKRQRLPTVRLGGKKPRRGFFLVRFCRRVKLKLLRAKYLCMLKKLKKYYDSVVKDMMDGSATKEYYQQRMLLETSFAVPVMGLAFVM